MTKKRTNKLSQIIDKIWNSERDFVQWDNEKEIVSDLQNFDIAHLEITKTGPNLSELYNSTDTSNICYDSSIQKNCCYVENQIDPLYYVESINNGCVAYRNIIRIKQHPLPSKLLKPSEWNFAQWDESNHLHFIAKDNKSMVIFSGDFEKENPLLVLRLWGTDDLEKRASEFFEQVCSVAELNYAEETNQTKFNLIMRNPNTGFFLKESNNFSFNPIDYDLHYNESIHKFNKRMEEWKTWDKPNNRLCILRGEKGTGKTNWIRNYLQNWEGKIIFVPPAIAPHMTDPEFLPFMSKHTGALLWLEDAEQIMESRENTKDLSVSNLLNMTDGVMVDHLDFKIIVTHNAHKNFIDSALRRGNRCWAEYGFDKLSPKRTKNLCEELEVEPTESEMTISDIFALQNQWDMDNDEPVQIGFNQ